MRTARLKKQEPKPLTAQPVGSGFRVNGRGEEHLRRWGDLLEMVSDNELSSATGCFRRVPTCKE